MNRKQLIFTGLMLIVNTFGVSAQFYKALYVDKAGTMISQITEEEANKVTHLTIVGKMNAIDFRHLRDEFPNLSDLDISNVDVRLYAGKAGTHFNNYYVYPMNSIPAYAFCRMENDTPHGKLTLRKVVLSEKTLNIEDGAFLGCDNLHVCIINKKKAPNLLKDGLNDQVTAIFIPLGSKDEYRLKKGWENFAFIEGEPVEATLRMSVYDNLSDQIRSLGLQPSNIHFLTITGKLDANDLRLITDYMPNLIALDIYDTTVTALPDFTFAQKKNLLRINLPKGLVSIGQRVFSGCGRLSGTLTLPPNVTSIDYGAFMGCDNLVKVVAINKLTMVGAKLFGDSPSRLYYAK